MPENALTGTIFVANAQRVDAMAVDGARYGAHRAWWGTNVARMAGLPLGVEPMVLYPGLLGHEWDEVARTQTLQQPQHQPNSGP
jgi:hypothetical protein